VRFPRMTTRRWMIAVSVVGLLLGSGLWGERLNRLSQAYRVKSVTHARQETLHRRELALLRRIERKDPTGSTMRTIALQEALIDHHVSWARRYKHAAQRPWEFIPPEPPPPTWASHGHKLSAAIVANTLALKETFLNLHDAGVTDDLLEPIGNCHQLVWLDLSGNPISDTGLVHLKALSNLQSLKLDQTGISDAGLIHLQGLSGLKALDLYRTRITKEGLRFVGQALPHTMVMVDPELVGR
jgi:hypothetical protein